MTTPDTFTYMIAGYAVLAVVLGVYLASFFTRFRSLKKDLELLQEIEQ
ncbi:MAG: hypothetical protein H8E28_07015 [Anaerolineae bacterium]|nr:hypothetical protein [Anaerolineae bacterium]MBL6965038.1 hypothetical protein [Anaerolineales bacterium]